MGKRFEVGHRYLSAEEYDPINVVRRTEKCVWVWWGWNDNRIIISKKLIRYDEDGNEQIFDTVPKSWRDPCRWNAKWDEGRI